MTPFTQPHEGEETLATGLRAATGAVIQLGNHSKVKRGRGRVRPSSAAPAISALI